MNIVFVNSTHNWGGVKTWCLDMATCFCQDGHLVRIVGREGTFLEKAKTKGIHATAHAFGADFSPRSFLFFYRLFKKEHIDLVICNISKDLRTAGVAARMLGIPIVQHLGAPKDVTRRLKTSLTQRLLCPCLVTCSEFCKKELLQAIPVFANYPFAAIYPGTKIAPKVPDTVHTPRRIIATSQLSKIRKYSDMLAGLSILRKESTAFSCMIIGTGPEEKQLKELAQRMELDIHWKGFVTNVQDYLQEADIFILPTSCEALGIALEEAMAYGLVPIARNVCGPPEIWPDGMRYLLVSPDAEGEEFAEVLKELIELDDKDLLELKQRTYEHAKKTFAQENQYQKFLSWLQTSVL